MPGWHQRTKQHVKDGNLQVYGIAPEQYGDRMALFQQWKQLDFPVLIDPMNLIGVKAVPITLLVDEHGTIRYRNPKSDQFMKFLQTTYTDKPVDTKKQTISNAIEPASEALNRQDVEAIRNEYSKLTENKSMRPVDAFRAGVMQRWLYDHGVDASFQKAIDYWSGAINKEPNQYIWRRRIQQYGPRLDKPYPFYNWIEQAQKEIIARGETPVSVLVEPSLSERSSPARSLASNDQSQQKTYPDTDNKLTNDTKQLTIDRTTIPHTQKKGYSRIHLKLTPTKKAYWSSDSQDIALWLSPKSGDPILLTDQPTVISSEAETSRKARYIEVDIKDETIRSGELVLFYSICNKDGVCHFLKTEIQ